VQETAVRALARIRAEDKEAFASIRRALTALAEQPHPPQAVAWGGSGIYRLHLPGIPDPVRGEPECGDHLHHQRRRHRLTSNWMTSAPCS
jgi:hypothetical protein